MVEYSLKYKKVVFQFAEFVRKILSVQVFDSLIFFLEGNTLTFFAITKLHCFIKCFVQSFKTSEDFPIGQITPASINLEK